MDQNDATPARGAKAAASSRSRSRSRHARTRPSLPAAIQDQIGRQLRAAYDDVLKEPVPERFLTLLQQLDQTPAPEPKPDPTAQSPVPQKGRS